MHFPRGLSALRRAALVEEEMFIYRGMVESELGGAFSRGISARNSVNSVNGRSPTSTIPRDVARRVAGEMWRRGSLLQPASNGSSPAGTWSGGGVPGDLVAMLKLQRKVEAVVREKEELGREASRLSALVAARPVAEAWAAALGTYESMAAQDALMAKERLAQQVADLLRERERLGPLGVDWQRFLDG